MQSTLEHPPGIVPSVPEVAPPEPPPAEPPAPAGQPSESHAFPAATPRRARRSWVGGGTAGNEQLVAMAGVVLIVQLAFMGITILRIHQLLSVHMAIGILLAGPIGLKLASTGYRFVRYYTGDPAYRRKGPPKLSLRLLAPVLVLATVSLFLSGLVLMLEGTVRSQQVILIHKASFVIWIGVAALHVLSHLPKLGSSLHAVRSSHPTGAPGAIGRWIAVAGAVGTGLGLAVVLSAHFTI